MYFFGRSAIIMLTVKTRKEIFMRKQRLARIGAATLAAVLTVQGMGFSSTVYAKEEPVRVKADSQTQMSSEPEQVAVKDYGSNSARTQNFDSDWKFNLGDVSNAQTPTFDDSKWRTLSLPHDYSIEQEYSQSLEAESGYLPGGVGWYRKNFTLGEEAKGKRIRIDFDGVYMNATVYVNGKEVGTHPYGYTPFSFDITDYISYDKENTIAVKVDHQTPSSRWYSGSGIYRSVNLTTTNDVHVDLNGIKVESNNLEKEAGKTVNTDVKTTVVNGSKEAKNITITHTVFKKGEKPDKAIGTFTTEAKEVKEVKKASETSESSASNTSTGDHNSSIPSMNSLLTANADGTYNAVSNHGIKYKITREITPTYPKQAENIRYRKKVIVKAKFLVDQSGNVKNISIIDSHSKLGFDQAVIDALGKWKFSPIVFNGKVISVYFQKEFVFEPKL